MSDTVERLRRQMAEAEENLRLIQERQAQYVLETDIPLQLIKEERRLRAEISTLRVRLTELAQAQMDADTDEPRARRDEDGQARPEMPERQRVVNARPPDVAHSRSDRFALVIANSEYDDPKLTQLATPSQDAKALAKVLRDPAIGGFDVALLVDQTMRKVRAQIGRLYRRRKKNDLILAPSQAELREQDGLPHPSTCKYRFGSWNKALEAAGLAPRRRLGR